MRAFATTNPATLRRWAISAMVVVLVHGAIVTAVVTWRKVTVPAEPLGPVVIELAPMPAAPTTEQAALPPAAEKVPSVSSPDKPLGNVEEKAEEKTASRGEEKTAPSQFEAAPQVTPPVTLAPSDSTDQREGGQTRAATGGGIPGAAPSQQGELAPLDTRIGESPRLRFKNAGKASDWKKAIIGHPSKMASPLKNFGGRQAGRAPGAPSDAAGGWARNSIGMLTPNSAGAAKGLNGADGVKNALGISAGGDNGIARNAATATNALGITVPIRTRLPRTNIGQHGSGGMLASSATTTPGAVINGTGMIRPTSAGAVIGGPAKNAAGGINGTTIRPR